MVFQHAITHIQYNLDWKHLETDKSHECILIYKNHAMPLDKKHVKKSLQGKTNLADKHLPNKR